MTATQHTKREVNALTTDTDMATELRTAAVQ